MRSLAYNIELSFYADATTATTERPATAAPTASAAEPVTIVMPARNESGNESLIRDALDRIAAQLADAEIVLVEGNSSDNTYQMLEAIVADYRGRLSIQLKQQNGKGKKNAVVCGFSGSSGETLAIIDTDFTVDINDSIQAIKHASTSKCCLVNCTRTIYPMEQDAMRWTNYIGNRFFALLVSYLTAQNVSDSLCGTKIFSRHLYESMLADGSWLSVADPFGDFTILFGASRYHYRILNYPVRYKARASGAPNISRWVDGLSLLRLCLRNLFSA